MLQEGDSVISRWIMKPFLLCTNFLSYAGKGGLGVVRKWSPVPGARHAAGRATGDGALQAAGPTLTPRPTRGPPGSYYKRVRGPADGGSPATCFVTSEECNRTVKHAPGRAHDTKRLTALLSFLQMGPREDYSACACRSLSV